MTVYGIETAMGSWIGLQDRRVATVLTVYGIETCDVIFMAATEAIKVATVLTVYGIETPF